jgi:Glycosyltransferase family 17
MSRVWDTFIFRDELDMLECRLTELDATDIYRFVLVEAAVDHQGKPKPLYYREHKERFAPWADRIICVTAGELPDQGPWQRINAQREYIAGGLAEAEQDDIIIHSDLDEILAPAGVEAARNPGFGIKFRQRCAVFAVDWLLPWDWDGPVAAYAGAVRSFTQFRDASWPVTGEGGGWHLSWLGGNAAIRAKREAYCHTEMDEYIDRGLETDQFYGRGIFWGHGQGDTQLLAVDVDETWPKWVHTRECPENWFRPRKEEA